VYPIARDARAIVSRRPSRIENACAGIDAPPLDALAGAFANSPRYGHVRIRMTEQRPNLAIRRAVPADAQALSALATRTFTETFGHLYPPEDLSYFLEEAYAATASAGLLRHAAYAP
jgi:hypothetical protein